MEYDEIEYLYNLTEINLYDNILLNEFIVKYINPVHKICMHCPAQIRSAHNIFKKWVDNNKNEL